MNKSTLLLFIALILIGCARVERPERYKGCVVMDKSDSKLYNLRLKLTIELSDEIGLDYCWITVPEFELNKLNIGDTIK